MGENYEVIYLQCEEDGDQGRTWCQDRINDDDVKYIRADLVERIFQPQKNWVKERKEYGG